MPVDWQGWAAFEGAIGQPLADVERASAKRYFDALMTARPERRRQLEDLLRRNGTTLGVDDAGIQALNDWYREHVEAAGSDPSRLSARWFAVGLDTALYLGDAILERAPRVEWRLFVGGRRDASYQRPVLMGFERASNPKYNVDPERLVGVHGHRLIAGLVEPRDCFVQVVRSAAMKA